jgi:branched-chain amino acid transport system substrate-binding protein
MNTCPRFLSCRILQFRIARRLIAHLALLAAVLFGTGCVGDDDPASRSGAQGRGNGPIVIGAAWPWEARHEVRYWEGLQLALEEINAQGGVLGRSVRILRDDDHEDIDRGRLIAQRFADDAEITAVIGHLQSYVTIPAAAIYDLSGMVLIAATATSPELTSRGYRSVFRTIFSDEEVGRNMADVALARGHTKVGIYYARDAYGRGLANAFEEQIVMRGGRVQDRRAYDPSASLNPRPAEQAAEMWSQLELDAVFVGGQGEQAGMLAAELRRSGLALPLLGSDAVATPEFLRLAGDAAEGAVIATPFHADVPEPDVQRFVTSFRDRFGFAPDVGAALGYDALQILVQAMRVAGSSVPAQVAVGLRSLDHWPAVTGGVTFDEAGNRVAMPIRLLIVRAGVFEYLGEAGADGERTRP